MLPEIGIGESALLTDIAMCVNYYRLFSPGLYCCVHAPLQLHDAIRLRPGILVMVNHGELKQCDPGPEYDCFRGPPNFVLDVFPGDDLDDYQVRRSAFERAALSVIPLSLQRESEQALEQAAEFLWVLLRRQRA